MSSQRERIFYDSSFKTFRLYPGDSLYAFSISPELSLEHLYWGKRLSSGYDLRYLSQSSRMSTFDTSEISDTNVIAENATRDLLSKNLQWETVESLQELWKRNKNAKVSDVSDTESIQKLRMENLSWRLMSKLATCSLNSIPTGNSSPNMNAMYNTNPLSLSIDMEDSTNTNAPSSFSPIRRSRSATTLSHDLKTPTDNAKLSMSPMSPRKPSFSSHRRAFDRKSGLIGKGNINVEYADHGTGDFRSPSFVAVDTYQGSSISPLRYHHHEIFGGKKLRENSPGIRSVNDDEATTLIVTMIDEGSGLEVDLVYVCMHHYDALIRYSVFRNTDNRLKQKRDGSFSETMKILHKCSSFTLDCEVTATPFYIVQLSGSWGRERDIIETKLTHGIQSFGSTRGVSGHQHNPFCALSIGPPSETNGEVKGFSLIYSGNFECEAELSEMGRLRMNMGIHQMGFQWHLVPGNSFYTPEAVLVRSNRGLGGMSRVLHRLFLDHLIRPLPRWARNDPPILLNSWESCYFDVNHSQIVEMARQGSKLGINLIVLDDGWFGKRDDITSSLGDWQINTVKFPFGLESLAEEVRSYNCKFGIWIEPEMVSEKSNLYQLHPEWYLHVPQRPRQAGRNQGVLDLSREDVIQYLFSLFKDIFVHVDYVKWDMNRPLTEVYSLREPDYAQIIWQSETAHRYVLGVYKLQQMLVTEFPNVLLENCASGGGRFDPGMLFYSPQIWCSDNTDAICRMKIQYGTSIAYPASCIGSHVSTVPNHITGNSTRNRTRCLVAMCGTFGFELNVTELSHQDKSSFKESIEIYKAICPIIRNGDIYRLWDPFKVNFAAWMYVTRNKKHAVVFGFSMNSDHWSSLVPRLHLQGLAPDIEYEITEPYPNNIIQNSGNNMIIESEVPIYQLGYHSVTLTGEILMFVKILSFYFS